MQPKPLLRSVRRSLWLVIPFLASPAAALAASHAPGTPAAGEPFTVTATPASDENATAATLKYCIGTPGAIEYCYLPLDMARQSDGAFRATTREGFRGGESIGWNVTLHLAGGGNVTYPRGADYEFLTVAEARALPLAPLAGALALALAPALARAAGGRR